MLTWKVSGTVPGTSALTHYREQLVEELQESKVEPGAAFAKTQFDLIGNTLC